MSPNTGRCDDAPGRGPSANEMTSVGPAWPRCFRLSRAMCGADTSVTETKASRTRSAFSTEIATARIRARDKGARVFSAATSTTRLTKSSSRFPPRVGGPRWRRTGVSFPACRRGHVGSARFRRAEFRGDPAARGRIVDARVVHPRENARELLLHRLELRLRDGRVAQLSLIDA